MANNEGITCFATKSTIYNEFSRGIRATATGKFVGRRRKIVVTKIWFTRWLQSMETRMLHSRQRGNNVKIVHGRRESEAACLKVKWPTNRNCSRGGTLSMSQGQSDIFVFVMSKIKAFSMPGMARTAWETRVLLAGSLYNITKIIPDVTKAISITVIDCLIKEAAAAFVRYSRFSHSTGIESHLFA